MMVELSPGKLLWLIQASMPKTGGRLLAVSQYIDNDEAFCLTYGDGVSDVDISASIEFHKKHGKLAT